MNDRIQAENISKRFRSTSALNQVTLTVPGGAIYALLGSNVGQTQYDFTIPDFRLPSYQPDMGLPNGSMSIGFTTQ